MYDGNLKQHQTPPRNSFQTLGSLLVTIHIETRLYAFISNVSSLPANLYRSLQIRTDITGFVEIDL